jgi:uncharacterized protein
MVGLTGVGGGALTTPQLVLLFGVAPAAAVGTALWNAALTKIVGGATCVSRQHHDEVAARSARRTCEVLTGEPAAGAARR